MRSKDFWCSALNLACTEKFNPSIRHGKGSQWIEKKYYLPTSYTSALLKYLLHQLHKNVYFMPESLFTQCERVLFFCLQTRLYHVSCFSRKYFALNHNNCLNFSCFFANLKRSYSLKSSLFSFGAVNVLPIEVRVLIMAIGIWNEFALMLSTLIRTHEVCNMQISNVVCWHRTHCVMGTLRNAAVWHIKQWTQQMKYNTSENKHVTVKLPRAAFAAAAALKLMFPFWVLDKRL